VQQHRVAGRALDEEADRGEVALAEDQIAHRAIVGLGRRQAGGEGRPSSLAAI